MKNFEEEFNDSKDLEAWNLTFLKDYRCSAGFSFEFGLPHVWYCIETEEIKNKLKQKIDDYPKLILLGEIKVGARIGFIFIKTPNMAYVCTASYVKDFFELYKMLL